MSRLFIGLWRSSKKWLQLKILSACLKSVLSAVNVIRESRLPPATDHARSETILQIV